MRRKRRFGAGAAFFWNLKTARDFVFADRAWFLHCPLRCILMAKKGDRFFGI
jgi:hypothetical protein